MGANVPAGYGREAFEILGKQSIPFLAIEVGVARPRLVITLGSEVAGILRSVHGQTKRHSLLGQGLEYVTIGDRRGVPMVHLAHPGIVMREATARNPWPTIHRQEHAYGQTLARNP